MAIHINPNQFLQTQNTLLGNKVASSNKALTQSLAKTVPGIKIGEKQSPEATARNILGFVKNGLSQLASQGASDERLQQRLEAARQGIEKGYKEATEILKGLGLYDAELKDAVDAGRKLVDSGLEELANNLGKLQNPAPVSQARTALATANSLTLEVLTREGDRVSVSFAQQSGQASNGNTSVGMSQQSWSMSVEGHLSTAEQEALSALFDDAQQLSERFFAGDIGRALEDAMSLGFDGKQLASMSLNLTQRTSFSVTSPYSAVKEQLPTPQLESLKAPLASYVDSYMKALDRAQPLAQPALTLQDLVQKMLPEESRMPIWNSFHEGLNQLLTTASNRLNA